MWALMVSAAACGSCRRSAVQDGLVLVAGQLRVVGVVERPFHPDPDQRADALQDVARAGGCRPRRRSPGGSRMSAATKSAKLSLLAAMAARWPARLSNAWSVMATEASRAACTSRPCRTPISSRVLGSPINIPQDSVWGSNSETAPLQVGARARADVDHAEDLSAANASRIAERPTPMDEASWRSGWQPGARLDRAAGEVVEQPASDLGHRGRGVDAAAQRFAQLGRCR